MSRVRLLAAGVVPLLPVLLPALLLPARAGAQVEREGVEEVAAAPAPSEAQRLRALADQRYLEGSYEEAAGIYHQIAAMEPSPEAKVEALFFAAQLEHQLGQNRLAFETLLEALRILPSYPFEPANYPNSFVVLYQDAFQTAFAQSRRAASDATRQGIQKRQEGDSDGARQLFEEALEIDAGHPVPRFYLGLMDLEAGRTEEGERRLRQVLELADANRDSRLHTDLRAQALIRLAQIDASAGRDEAAIAGFQKILSLDRAATESPLSPQLRLQALGRLGLLFYRIEMYEDAATTLGEAVRLDPEDASAWHNLGLAQRRLGRAEEAEASLRRALELTPGDPAVARSLAQSYAAEERWAEAAQVLAAAARDRNDAPELWLELGLAQSRAGDDAASIESWRRVLELDPENRQSQAQPASLRLAMAHYAAGRHAEAAAQARRAADWDAGDLAAWNVLGMAQQAAGEHREALASFRRAAELDPDRAELIGNVAIALLAVGEAREAEEAFRRALEMRPDQPALVAALDDLRRGLRAAVTRLGFEVSDSAGAGAAVERVDKPTPASAANLRPGDVIVAFDGHPISGADDLRYLLFTEPPSGQVAISVRRQGRPRDLRLRLD